MNTIDRIIKLMEENNVKPYTLEKENIVKNASTLIGHWKSGRQKPSAEILHKIADYFNVSVDYLMCRTDIKKPDSELSSEERAMIERVSDKFKRAGKDLSFLDELTDEEIKSAFPMFEQLIKQRNKNS